MMSHSDTSPPAVLIECVASCQRQQLRAMQWCHGEHELLGAVFVEIDGRSTVRSFALDA
jgi:hypothetical protein